MKKIILTFAAAACVLTVGAQQRTVLYEEFTGENCGPCAAANPTLESMMTADSGKIIHVTYMEPVPTTGYFYQSVQTLNDARFQTYYGAVWGTMGGEEFTPSGFMDGIFPDTTSATSGCGNCGNVAAFMESDIDAEYAVPSPFKITATHYFNTAHDSVYGKVIINGVSAYGGRSLKLRVAYVKTIDFTRPPGDNGETHFQNVARAMFPSETGQTIATSWTATTVDTYSYAGVITHLDTFTNVTTEDSSFVVWIQNDSTAPAVTNRFRVQQAAYSVYTPLSTHVHTAGVAPVATAPISMSIYPNPARETATVYFTLSNTADVQVNVIDELGRTVTSVPSQNMNSGNQSIAIATNALSAGVYTVSVQVNGTSFTKQLSVAK